MWGGEKPSQGHQPKKFGWDWSVENGKWRQDALAMNLVTAIESEGLGQHCPTET